MFAVLDISGFQYKVKEGDVLLVNRLSASLDQELTFDKILLFSGGDNLVSVRPKSSTVKVQVLDHLKGDKVIVFKKKRRKGYKVKNGHRQGLSKIKVLKLTS